jgi:photosystem II stability/assembly factor-like uncharacterized protein
MPVESCVHRPGEALTVLLALACTSLPSLGQGATWTKQAPVPTASSLMSLAVVSQDEVWGVSSPMLGDAGLLVHTTDAGATWNVVDPHSQQLNAVFFLDAQHGWAAGNNFLHTTDGGQTWVKDNDWGSIYDLFVLDLQHGWACGNGAAAYRTTNGGLTWSGVTTPGGATMSSIWFTDLLNGWSVSIDGRIVRTIDGGQTWSLSHNSGGYLSTIQFFDALEGWAIGGDTFVHTTNGGQTWTPVAVPPGTWSHGARFSDRLHGVSAGEYGNLTVTQNGGQTWTTIQPSGTGPRLWEVEVADATTFFDSGDAGAMSRSLDGGLTWHSIQSGGTGITRAIDILDAQHAWAANEGGEVLETVNGGQNWQRSVVGGFDNFGTLHDVDFVNPSVGWVVGTNDFFGGSDGRISRTINGGQNWTLQLSLPGVEFLGVAALSSSTALAFGRGLFASSVLLRTTNGGLSWNTITSAAGDFRGSYFLDASTGWIVGSRIHKTLDGGATWTEQYPAGGAELSAVSFSDPQNGWAVGFANQVLRTTNGGQTWTPQTISAPPLTAFLGVTAVSPATAWVAGWNGLAARTTNGGASWQLESIPGAGGAYFECAELVDAETGWVAGDLGIYMREFPGGCSTPSRYCTAKANSQGCTPTIAWSGNPSASQATPFSILASNVISKSFGLLIYSKTGAAAQPFQGGFLCLQSPVLRTALQNAGGNGPPVDCSGTFTFEFNDYIATGADPGLKAGKEVWTQYWYRDTGSTSETGLTGALHFTICP